MGGGTGFQNQVIMRGLEHRYFDIVDQKNWRGWTRYAMCMNDTKAFGIPLPDMENFTIIFKDSVRVVPNWEEQGVSPERFSAGKTEPIPMSQCPAEVVPYSLSYGVHHRRIERVAMVLQSLGEQFEYLQSYFPMICLFYMAAVRCPTIGSHQAEVLAYVLMRRAITLGVSSVAKTAEFMAVCDPIFEEIIPEKYRSRDRNLREAWRSLVGGQRLAAGALVLDVNYWTRIWEFGSKMSVFAGINYGFAMKARLESWSASSYYRRHRRYGFVSDLANPYTAAELNAVYSKAERWFRANQDKSYFRGLV